jgi:Reverse transcriptase (RNA-dependent DNA polymerase)
MPVSLGTLTFDDDVVVKQLRGDMKDDWFADPLLFRDMLNSGLLNKIISTNYSENDGQYRADTRSLYNIPKPNLTLRYALETGLSDRFLYHALVSDLVPLYDPLLGPSVYSHRYDHAGENTKYLFKKGVGAWNDFIGSVSSAVKPGIFLLSSDLTNYFEAIDLVLLKTQLIGLIPELAATSDEKAKARLMIDLLFESLRKWTFNDKRGLPQNRDASSFLANIYMVPIDREMKKYGYGDIYFRYMDDIKIVCESEAVARLALKRLILSLRKQGLSVNAKKTVIIDSNNTDKIGECLQHVSATVTYIDSIWKTNISSKILEVLPLLRDYTISLVESSEFGSKDFRFCINRLYTVCMCPSLSIPPEYFAPVTPKILDGLDVMPAATDQFSKYLRAAPTTPAQLERVADFLMDSGRSIYNWQNYQMWVALTDKKHQSKPLSLFASQVVATNEDSPSRAGASLYLGATGDASGKELVANRFGTLSSFLGQRIALISLHELPFKPLINDLGRVHTIAKIFC